MQNKEFLFKIWQYRVYHMLYLHLTTNALRGAIEQGKLYNENRCIIFTAQRESGECISCFPHKCKFLLFPYDCLNYKKKLQSLKVFPCDIRCLKIDGD